jgi:hypothetical protein
MWCYYKHLWEHIGNLIRTWWKHTHWEHQSVCCPTYTLVRTHTLGTLNSWPTFTLVRTHTLGTLNICQLHIGENTHIGNITPLSTFFCHKFNDFKHGSSR